MGKAKREKGRARLAAKNVTLGSKMLCADGRCLVEVVEEPGSMCQLCLRFFCGDHLFRVFSHKTKKQIAIHVRPPGEVGPPIDDFFCDKCGDKMQKKQ